MKSTGKSINIRKLKKYFFFLNGDIINMQYSVLKSFMVLQSNLLPDRIDLQKSLPLGFKLDFLKNKFYLKLLQQSLLNSEASFRSLVLPGNGALLFTDVFDFKTLGLLREFYLNTPIVTIYLTSYKGFIFDLNRLNKLSQLTCYADIFISLITPLSYFCKNMFLTRYHIFYCYRFLLLIQHILFKQSMLLLKFII